MEFKWSLPSGGVISIHIFQAMRLGEVPKGMNVNGEKKRSRD